MSLFLHICTGLGLALAAGIRPFTPAWLAGALAGANVLFDFHGTDYAFLQSAAFLLVVALIFVASAILAAHHDAAWPGLIGGVLAAGLAQFASRPILAGASERLSDGAARFAVLLYAD